MNTYTVIINFTKGWFAFTKVNVKCESAAEALKNWYELLIRESLTDEVRGFIDEECYAVCAFPADCDNAVTDDCEEVAMINLN